MEWLPLGLWFKCTFLCSLALYPFLLYLPSLPISPYIFPCVVNDQICLIFRTYCFDNASPNAKYQLWDTAPYGTTGLIKLHATPTLCLDGGSNPSNNGVVKVWTCGTFAQQQWAQFGNQGIVSTSNSTSLTLLILLPFGSVLLVISCPLIIDQCLDVQLGSGPSSQPIYNNQGVLQTYQCYPGSQQQNFHLLN